MNITLTVQTKNSMARDDLRPYLEAQLQRIADEMPLNPDDTRPYEVELTLTMLSGKSKKLPEADTLTKLRFRGQPFEPADRFAPRPQNEARGIAFDALKTLGWHPTTRGWPTFFCEKRGAVALVCVTASRGRHLRGVQDHVMRELGHYGVPVYRFDPATRFSRIALSAPQEGAEADDTRVTITRTDLDDQERLRA